MTLSQGSSPVWNPEWVELRGEEHTYNGQSHNTFLWQNVEAQNLMGLPVRFLFAAVSSLRRPVVWMYPWADQKKEILLEVKNEKVGNPMWMSSTSEPFWKHFIMTHRWRPEWWQQQPGERWALLWPLSLLWPLTPLSTLLLDGNLFSRQCVNIHVSNRVTLCSGAGGHTQDGVHHQSFLEPKNNQTWPIFS